MREHAHVVTVPRDKPRAGGHRWPRILALIVFLGALGAAASRPLLARYVDLGEMRFLDRAERLYREGERLAAAGQPAESILALRQAVTVNPAHLPALRRLGAAYEAQERRRQAAQIYERVLALAPEDAATRQSLATLYQQLGLPERAAQFVADESAPAGPAPQLTTTWQTTLEEHAISGLALADATLYATTQGGSLYALDRARGVQRWRFQAEGAILSRPVYSPGEGGLVILGCDDHRLYAVSAADGREHWRFETRGPIHGAPAISGDTVYAGSTDGHLYALSRDNGSLRWHFDAGAAIHAAPLVISNTVYLGVLNGNVYALNAQTGALRWRYAAGAEIESTPALQGERLYVGANDSQLHCLHPTSGRRLWQFSTGDAIYPQPLLAAGKLYVASASQTLYALSPDTGELQWRYDAGRYLNLAPALERGTLYLAAISDPHLYALEAETGRLLWAHDTGDWPSTEPLIAGGLLYLGEKDGTVLAYALPDS